MATSNHLLISLTLSLLTISAVTAHNITAILSSFPEYSTFNNYLSQTKLCDEINNQKTITVLVLNNSIMSTFTASHPISVIKNALGIHALLDYWDPQKLHQIFNGTANTTTLYQNTGKAVGNDGSVNIADLKGGKAGFRSADQQSKFNSFYKKSVKEIPYNITVLEIDNPIIVPAIMNAPAPVASDVNITDILENNGCKTFVKLITDNGVLKVYLTAVSKGLTVFAPSDDAFTVSGLPDVTKLNNTQLISLLMYHALPNYSPKETLKITTDSLNTLATTNVGKYELTVTTAGDSVTLNTGVDTARISTTIIDTTPLCIFKIDRILLPVELFATSPSSAPEPAPLAPKSARAPSPFVSPPAPPSMAPADVPADSPAADSADSSNVAGGLKAPAMLIGFVSVFGVISSFVS